MSENYPDEMFEVAAEREALKTHKEAFGYLNNTEENKFRKILPQKTKDAYNLIAEYCMKEYNENKYCTECYDKLFTECVACGKIVEKCEDYIFYGKRREGIGSKPDHYEIDVQMLIYSTKLFEGLDLVKDDYLNIIDMIKKKYDR
jgi:hypothetical protein